MWGKINIDEKNELYLATIIVFIIIYGAINVHVHIMLILPLFLNMIGVNKWVSTIKSIYFTTLLVVLTIISLEATKHVLNPTTILVVFFFFLLSNIISRTIYKKYQATLEKSELELMIYDKMEMQILVCDSDLQVLFANNSYKKMVGMQNITGKSIYQLYTPEELSLPVFKRLISYVQDSIEYSRINTILERLHLLGRVSYMTIRITPIELSKPNRVVALLQFFDNTVEYNQIKALNEMEDKIHNLELERTIFTPGEVCVGELNLNDKSMKCSENLQLMLTDTQEEIHDLDSFFNSLSDSGSELREKLEYAIENKENQRFISHIGDKFIEVKFEIIENKHTNKVKKVIFFLRDVTNYLDEQQKLRNEILEKDIFLRESVHRFRNGLASIVNYLDLQTQNQTSDQLIELLNEGKAKLLAIISLQDQVSTSAQSRTVNVANYIPDLLSNLLFGLNNHHFNIVQNYDIPSIQMSSKDAEILGLILIELVTNSFKYAFNQENENYIFIQIERDARHMNFFYQDYGRNNSTNTTNVHSTRSGLGLIKNLVTMLKNGECNISVVQGMKFSCDFTLRKY